MQGLIYSCRIAGNQDTIHEIHINAKTEQKKLHHDIYIISYYFKTIEYSHIKLF
jgi:hypothetical protein